MPDASETPSAFLDHLDATYALARVLTTDEDAAADLVTATFRQAANAPDRPSEPDALRTWLLRRLVETRRSRTTNAPDSSTMSDLQQEMAEDLLQRLLPIAFASRPHTERVLLTLCDINLCSPPAAAEILNLDETTAEERLQAARQHLWETVKAGATPPERRLLDNHLTAKDALSALPASVPDALDQTPPSLRPAAAAVLEQRSTAEPGGAPLEQSNTPRFGASSASQRSERSRSRARTKQSGLSASMRRSGAALIIIFVAGLIAYLLADALQPSSPEESSTSANLIELSAQHASQAQPDVSTRDPDEAERFVREQVGRALGIPRIKGAQLTGVGTVELTAQIAVPVVFFADSTTGERITTYVLDYALLDRFQDRVALTKDVRRTLEQERTVEARTINTNGVLIWRERDDIYVAITEGDPESVKTRIAPPSYK